jgi:hypothetical protein
MISAAENNHVAANARAGELNYRTANRSHVAFDYAFYNHVAAQRHRTLFYGARDPDGVAYSEDGAVRHAINKDRVFRGTFGGRVLRVDGSHQEQRQCDEREQPAQETESRAIPTVTTFAIPAGEFVSEDGL